LVVRSRLAAPDQQQGRGLSVRDGLRLPLLVPLVSASAPLVERFELVSGPRRTSMSRVLGVTAASADVLRLQPGEGRLLRDADVGSAAQRCVLGAGIARSLF